MARTCDRLGWEEVRTRLLRGTYGEGHKPAVKAWLEGIDNDAAASIKAEELQIARDMLEAARRSADAASYAKWAAWGSAIAVALNVIAMIGIAMISWP